MPAATGLDSDVATTTIGPCSGPDVAVSLRSCQEVTANAARTLPLACGAINR